MFVFDYLFVNSPQELFLLALIVALAGIVRGCIGFGFSALVIASSSLWIDVKYTVVMVIFMEVFASLFMFNSVKDEVDYSLLKALTIGGVLASFFGLWALITLDPNWHRLIMSLYLSFVALTSLLKFEFKKPMTRLRLYTTGLIAGFYNGLAGIGGIFVALMLSSSRYPVKNIRATIAVYFFIIELAFFAAAYYQNLVSKEVVITSFLLCFPMLIGIIFGAKLFTKLPEKILKQIVLMSLLLLSFAGLFKALF